MIYIIFQCILLVCFVFSESLGLLLGEQCSQLFSTLCETFARLSALAGRHSTSLNYFLHNGHIRDVTSLSLLTHTEFFQDTYKK